MCYTVFFVLYLSFLFCRIWACTVFVFALYLYLYLYFSVNVVVLYFNCGVFVFVLYLNHATFMLVRYLYFHCICTVALTPSWAGRPAVHLIWRQGADQTSSHVFHHFISGTDWWWWYAGFAMRQKRLTYWQTADTASHIFLQLQLHEQISIKTPGYAAKSCLMQKVALCRTAFLKYIYHDMLLTVK